ncbi:MAG: hypothetical protein AAFN93_20340 [Bacteroidota bacterium]
MDYTNSVTVACDKERAFDTLTNQIDKWWSTVKGPGHNQGDNFVVSFGEESYWKFNVLELTTPSKVVWECIESHQDHHLPGIDKEWLHSKLYWNISADDGMVTIQFLHKGLVPTDVCYDVCSTAWDFYILDSLKNYLEKGQGKPGEN